MKQRTRGTHLLHKFPKFELESGNWPGVEIGGVNSLDWRRLTLCLTPAVDAGLDVCSRSVLFSLLSLQISMNILTDMSTS